MSKMSREEAIKSLELSLGTYEALEIGEEELKMAIEALKKVPKLEQKVKELTAKLNHWREIM